MLEISSTGEKLSREEWEERARQYFLNEDKGLTQGKRIPLWIVGVNRANIRPIRPLTLAEHTQERERARRRALWKWRELAENLATREREAAMQLAGSSQLRETRASSRGV